MSAGIIRHFHAPERGFNSRGLSTWLAISTLALAGSTELSSNDASASTPPFKASAAETPQQIAAQAQEIVDTTVDAWSQHQLPDGSLVDPVVGRVRNYGSVMLGHAMAQRGAATNKPELVRAGLRTETDQILHPTYGGFERFALSEAYTWNQQNLADVPEWQASQPQFENFLSQSRGLTVGEKAQRCFALAHCWTNLKLIQAYANIKLLSTGLAGGQTGSEPATTAAEDARAALTKESRTLLDHAVQNTGNDARRLGSPAYGNAGINSDPSTYPLAYHALSTSIMGKSVEALGRRAPKALRQAFMRGNRALVGLMAPDGDVSYIGRGQGQVWTAAVAANSLAIAANNTPDPAWRARYLAGATRAIDRLKSMHPAGSWGMPLVPRLAGETTPDFGGVDPYANSVMYDGLAVWALNDAIQHLKNTPAVAPGSIGADSRGVFIDPSRAKFAAVRHGDLWYAVHGTDSHEDARYDFGVVAAMRKKRSGWRAAIPHRPYTEEASGGPVLISNGGQKVPVGETISARANGVVKVRGGWATGPGRKPSTDLGTTWEFRPLNNSGMRMEFQARKHRRFSFGVWHALGSRLITGRRSLEVVEPNGRHVKYRLNLPVRINTTDKVAHSAYDKSLQSSTITVKTRGRKQPVRFDTLIK